MNAVASHPREVQQLLRRQNFAADVQRVDPDAYQDLHGDRQREPLANSAAPRGGPEMNEKSIHSADVKPSRSRHILILDGQPAARFDSLPKAVAAIPPGLLFFYGVWGPLPSS